MSYMNVSELSNRELLKVIMREKSDEGGAVDQILSDKQMPDIFYDSTYEEFTKKYGVTKTRAEVLVAIQELYLRLNKADITKHAKITSPQDVYDLMAPEMKYLKKERFVTLLLNTKNEVLSIELISVGTLNASLVHPRDVMKVAVTKSAASVILCHNHPSFNHPEPSAEDKALTQRIKDASEIIGIKCLDHIIISGNRYFSFKENNEIL